MVRQDTAPDAALLDGLAAVLRDDSLDPSFRALVLTLPSQDDTAQALDALGETPDPTAVYRAHESLTLQIAQHIQDTLPRIYADMTVTGAYSPDAIATGKRALGNRMLSLMSKIDGGKQAAQQYAQADNMTQQLAALASLLKIGKGADELVAFEQQWQHDRLVMDKWFGLQVGSATPENAAKVVQNLTLNHRCH